jgi:undecaprenyl-diphosphatase
MAVSAVGLLLLAGLWAKGQAASDLAEATQSGMTVVQALVLGMVEGVTEYLPVSSTGHLLLAQRAMGIGGSTAGPMESGASRKEASDAYAICIQAGAILAVIWLYWNRIRGMALGLAGRDPAGLRLALQVAFAFLPAALLGLLLEGWIKSHLFGVWPVVAAWFVGGAGILWTSRTMGKARASGRAALDTMTWGVALLIGLAQCVAMWPGVSRSLATIMGGLLAGLSLPAAVEFSFLLGVVTLGAATGHDAFNHGTAMLEAFAPLPMALGFLAAFLSAVLAVRWMVGYLNRHGLEIFGYYRLALAIAVASLLLVGVI